MRSRSWAGYAEGQKAALLWGADRDIPDRSWFARQRLHYFVRQRWLNAYDITDDKLREFAELLLRWKPRYLIAYARAIYIFTQYEEEQGSDGIRRVAIDQSLVVLDGLLVVAGDLEIVETKGSVLLTLGHSVELLQRLLIALLGFVELL